MKCASELRRFMRLSLTVNATMRLARPFGRVAVGLPHRLPVQLFRLRTRSGAPYPRVDLYRFSASLTTGRVTERVTHSGPGFQLLRRTDCRQGQNGIS